MQTKQILNTQANTVIVLDFETSGLSPGHGDRAIEIGAVLLEEGKITKRFQKLMNPGFRISYFIESYTGITNQMLKKAPPCSEVMNEFADFIGDYNLVAHNASFDQRFLDAELEQIGRKYTGSFTCSMLTSRRIFQNAPNHKLGGLVAYHQLPNDGTFHRALADAEMTAHLWLLILNRIKNNYGINNIPFSLMQELSRIPKRETDNFLHSRAI